MINARHEEARMIDTPLVVRMVASLVEHEGHRHSDVHLALLQSIFQHASVFDPCIRRGLGLNDWSLAVPAIVGRHRKQIGEGVQAIRHIVGIAWPHTRVQTTKHKPYAAWDSGWPEHVTMQPTVD